MYCIRSTVSSVGFFNNAIAACVTSFKLCDGISVAIPTAMPDAPLSNTIGKRAGRCSGSSKRAVVVRHEIHCPLIDFGQQQFRNRRQPRFGVTHRRRPVAVTRTEVADAVD